MQLYDAVQLYARALHSVLQGGGMVHQAYRVVEAMKEVSFDGASGMVSLGDHSCGELFCESMMGA